MALTEQAKESLLSMSQINHILYKEGVLIGKDIETIDGRLSVIGELADYRPA